MKFLFSRSLLITALITACQPAGQNRVAPIVNVDDVIEAKGVSSATSTILVTRLSDGAQWVSNINRSKARFSPASTSKIPHTLIAIETGFAAPDTEFEWDGTERFYKPWNQNQTLASAFKYSAVWVYQEISASLGHEAMAKWIDAFDYGNEETGPSENLTTYWLDKTLQISAEEQIGFLTRLARQELPLSADTYETALPLMIREYGDGWTLYAKTGWFFSETETDIGWFVGWVETSEDTYVFAFNLDMDDPKLRRRRIPPVKAVLKGIGALQ